MPKSKPVRVWVAVDDEGRPFPWTSAEKKRFAKLALEDHFVFSEWRAQGITIRRATLTVDPVKTKKRRKP